MNRNLFILLCFCYLFPWSEVNAQDKQKMPQYAVSVEPLHLINGGLRLNLEKKGDQNDWLEMSLTGYLLPHRDMQAIHRNWWDQDIGGYSTANTDFDWISGLHGLGAGAAYKHYFPGTHCMISTGLSYNWYNVEYPGYDFQRYVEDGLPLYHYTLIYEHQSFQKLAVHVTGGIRTFFRHKFFMEFYGGIGYTHSFYDSNKRNFNDTMFGYGYRGVYLTAGVKIGLNLLYK